MELVWSTVLLELMQVQMEEVTQFVLAAMEHVQRAMELDHLLVQAALVHCLFMVQIHAKQVVGMDNTP